MRFKKVLGWLGVCLALGFVWLAWPIYGFVSNQFEVARLPFGWTSLPSGPVPAESVVTDEAFRAAGDAALKALELHRDKIAAPSLSAAVAVDGRLVSAGAVGWADVAARQPANIRTRYRIGSTSKPVGITALARLVAAGAVELDAPIATYDSDLPDPRWGRFTLRQLASHTAGLPEYEDNSDWIGFYQSLALTTRFSDPRAALSVFDGSRLLFEPGQRFHYSGYDNILISAVLQNVYGKHYDALMQEQVFAPLDIRSIAADHADSAKANRATSYQVKDKKYKPWRRVDLSHKLAAGGFVATPSDLALLGSAWLDEAFIPAAVRDIFWTPAVLADGSINEQNYALGFRRHTTQIDGLGEVALVNHGGVSKGAQCWLAILPQHGLVIAISTNRRTDEFFDFAGVWPALAHPFLRAPTHDKS